MERLIYSIWLTIALWYLVNISNVSQYSEAVDRNVESSNFFQTFISIIEQKN